MFSYCLNDPVNHSDTTGNLPTKNDIISSQFMTEGGYGPYTGYTYFPETEEVFPEEVTQIISNTVEKTKHLAQEIVNSHVHTTIQQIETRQEQDQYVIAIVDYLAANPLVAVDATVSVVGLSLDYVSLCCAAGVISIPAAGQVALGVVGVACCVWGAGRLFIAIWDNER